MFINELFSNPSYYLSWVFVIVFSIVLHELGHGFAAIWQGDDTPRLMGHMTWDPVVHMGPVSLALVAVFGFGFGAMPVNPSRFRSRYGDAIVSFAGPAMNILIALISLTILGLWMRTSGDMSPAEWGAWLGPSDGTAVFLVGRILLLLGFLNIVLAVLNLMPIPPLDGSNVLMNFSPAYARIARDPNNQMIWTGCFIALFLMAHRFLLPMGLNVCDAWLRLFA